MGGETHKKVTVDAYPKRAAGPVGKKIHNLYEDRLRMFTSGGQYESASLLSKLYHGRASGHPAVKLSVYSPPRQSRPTFKDATSHKFEPTSVGQSFGPSWSTHWFKIELTVPSELKDEDHLEFHWNANNEGLIWTEDGVPLQGLTGGGDREEWILPKSFTDGKKHTFYIEMACNGMFGNAPGGDSIQPPNPDKYFQLSKADIVAVNLEARALYIDFWIIGDAAREFPQDSWQEHEALVVCNAIMDCFIAGKGSDDCIVDCRRIAKKFLGNNIDSAKVYESDEDVLVSGIGHCHIDTCWLWPWAETKRKVARSWSNQCDLIDRYPEHRFCCSQAQQYKWLKHLYPSVWDRVKTKVKEGKFQPIGGSWVEHDTNMPSGESLVRQFVYGQRFFEKNFGERCTTFWLPDTFGYSSQLPQLCRGAGMSRFFTQKLSWNNINNFPHTTFNWVALDGSQVICHMAPSETYTAEANFGDVKRSITQHKSMDQDATSLLVFGKGDGGGGPTWAHLEKLRRCRGVSDKVGLLPRLKVGGTVDEFFAQLEKKAETGTKYVTWYGELYFELHRGTYTTQANNKKNNRKAEVLLHDLEYLATFASLKAEVKGNSTYKYPKKEIDEMWEAVLLCQFHDCLPGSSIEMCYDDSDELYAKVFTVGEKLLSEALSALGFVSVDKGTGNVVAINTLPWERCETIKLPQAACEALASPFATINGGRGVCEIYPNAREHARDYKAAEVKELRPGVFQLSNDNYRITVDNGVITSLFDVYARREAIPPGQKANQLVLFDDKPLYWQAWDVEVYHLDSREELKPHKTSIIEQSANRVSLLIETKISEKSWVKTTLSLRGTVAPYVSDGTNKESLPPADYLEIASEITWHEKFKFLKVEFPVAVRNTEASYETQFGIVRRPTHYNTTWDMAKFEVCVHKWADLSEATYGVSILNDSKYGFATQGNVMRLSLVRAPKAPDAHADMGVHHVRYAILPHAGPLSHHTVRAGMTFNNPITTAQYGSTSSSATSPAEPPLFPFTSYTTHSPYLLRYTSDSDKSAKSLLSSIQLSRPISDDPKTEKQMQGLVIDTIKRGEDDIDLEGDPDINDNYNYAMNKKGAKRSVIVRIYDSLGGAATARLLFGTLPVTKVTRCNLLEDDDEELQIETHDRDVKVTDGSGGLLCVEQDRGVLLSVGAFEVITVKLWIG